MQKDSSRGGKPYIWVTWITGLLAGTDVCEWAAWYKAHHRFAKRVRPGDDGASLDQWKRDHDVMVKTRRSCAEGDGFTVTEEDENKFTLAGSATGSLLQGKPDLVVWGSATALVVDEKSGEPRESDIWQVRVYLFALPRVLKTLIGTRRLLGEVEYRGRSVDVDLTPQHAAKIVSTLQLVGGSLEPPRSPSIKECGFCDVANCPDRKEPIEHVAETSEF